MKTFTKITDVYGKKFLVESEKYYSGRYAMKIYSLNGKEIPDMASWSRIKGTGPNCQCIVRPNIFKAEEPK